MTDDGRLRTSGGGTEDAGRGRMNMNGGEPGPSLAPDDPGNGVSPHNERGGACIAGFGDTAAGGGDET